MDEGTEELAVYEEVQEPIWPIRAITMGAGAAGGMVAARALGLVARLGIAGVVAGGAGLLLGEFLVPMKTTLVKNELQIRFGKRTRFRIPLKNVTSAYARDYHPIREYGGWGIRMGGEGRAFNMRGNRGVQLVLRSGQRVLIGSETPEVLAEAIRAATGCAATEEPPRPEAE
jgi:hypothetical protein